MELNSFQKEVEKLWKDHKKGGLVIEAPRAVGKTSLILYLAAKESADVIVVSPLIISSVSAKSRFNKEYDKENIRFITKNEFMNMLWDPTVVYFFDEDAEWLPNVLSILTPKKKFVFGKEWLDIKSEDLEKMRDEMGGLCFNQEFETNIWSRY